MPTLILVRHGRSTANTDGVLAGRTPGIELDDPLGLGTTAYAPPELVRQRPSPFGLPVDIFSLGTTLTCLLTGREPFHEVRSSAQRLTLAARGAFWEFEETHRIAAAAAQRQIGLLARRDRGALGEDDLALHLLAVLGVGAGLAEHARLLVRELLDLAAEGRFEGGRAQQLDADAIRTLQSMKTGALLRFACVAGAILGEADASRQAALERYGTILGEAFQIADDLRVPVGGETGEALFQVDDVHGGCPGE